MMRFGDWERRLAIYLEPLRDRPFEWGVHDCCTFAAGAVEAMTGEQTMDEFLGRYSTKRGSLLALAKYGAGTLADTLDGKFKVVPVGHAHRGDVILTDGGKGLGLAMGAIAIRPGETEGRPGLIRVPRAEWERAWRVPMPGETP